MLKIPYPINEIIAPQKETQNGGRSGVYKPFWRCKKLFYLLGFWEAQTS